MKIIEIEVSVSTRYVGSKVEDVISVYLEDGATPEQIETAKEDAAREWMFEQITWEWKDIEA